MVNYVIKQSAASDLIYSATCPNTNKEVGYLWLTDDLADLIVVDQIHVDLNCQRQGIATALLKKALERYPRLVFPNVNRMTHEDEGPFLTEEGAAFMNEMLARRIISEVNLLQGDDSPCELDEPSSPGLYF